MKKIKLFVLLVTAISILCTLGAAAASNMTNDYSYPINGEVKTSALFEYDKGTKILFILTDPAEVRTTVNVPTSDIRDISIFSTGHSISNWNTYASNSDSTRTCNSTGKTTLSSELEDNQYATHTSHTATVTFFVPDQEEPEIDINVSESYSK